MRIVAQVVQEFSAKYPIYAATNKQPTNPHMFPSTFNNGIPQNSSINPQNPNTRVVVYPQNNYQTTTQFNPNAGYNPQTNYNSNQNFNPNGTVFNPTNTNAFPPKNEKEEVLGPLKARCRTSTLTSS